MAKIITSELAKKLIDHTKFNIRLVQDEFLEELPARFYSAPAAGKWSAASCLAHLNMTMEHYVPLMEKGKRTYELKGKNPRSDYNQAWTGKLIEKHMNPTEVNQVKKLPSSKSINPGDSVSPDAQVIETFFEWNHRLMQLMQSHKQSDWRKIKVQTLLRIPFRIQMGDALILMTYHNYRHLIQALKACDISYEKYRIESA